MLRQAETPLVAVVRLRKRNEWVLPKGKLDRGETPRAAAEREVNEETGHRPLPASLPGLPDVRRCTHRRICLGPQRRLDLQQVLFGPRTE